jgi:hypothetical protein
MKPYLFTIVIAILYYGFSFEEKKVQNAYISSIPGIGASFRIYPSVINQTETFITKHPLNPNILFASANTLNLTSGFKSEGVYVSTNGGGTWFGSDTCKGSPIQFHNGDPGIAIDKNGTFILVRLGFTPGQYSHYSTNNGITWSNQKTITDNDQDRPSLTSDGVPSSPFYGRTYSAWIRFAPPYPVNVAYTNDGGQNWTAPAQVNSPPQRGQGAEIEIGPNGEVYVTWAGVTSSSPFTEVHVGFAKSTNGSASWTTSETAFQMNGIQGTLPQKANIRVNGLPKIDVDKTGGSRNGWIYIVTTEKNRAPAGSDPDIIFHRSTDGGATWSNGIRVNQDNLNNGKIQYFPAVKVDGEGGINVIYYDDRRTTSDSAEVFMSRSTDGGNTWRDFPISGHKFKPVPIGGFGQGYQGDNIDIEVANNIIWPVWMDNSIGGNPPLYQIWTVPIDINTIGVNSNTGTIPGVFSLRQNYPNPFNPSTTIEYDLHNASEVTLAVYDVNGKLVKELFTGRQNAGNYKYDFNTADIGVTISSGVYYYRLQTAEHSLVKSMVLVK